MDNYQERAKALGLPDSNSNYIKSLWKEHCRDIKGLEFTDNENDDGEEDAFAAALADEDSIRFRLAYYF